MPRQRVGKRVFEQDFAGVGELLNSAHVADEMERRAHAVADRARATAPVRTSEYRNSIEVEADHTDRVRYNVISRAAHANAVEFRHRTLGTALDAAGG